AMNRVYRVEDIAAAEHAAGPDEHLAETIDISEAVTTAPAVKLVHALLARAVDEGASDLHFEPQARHVVVRARVDGVLRRLATIPRGMQPAVTGRLKVMGHLDIADHRAPQDGRMTVQLRGAPSTCASRWCRRLTAST